MITDFFLSILEISLSTSLIALALILLAPLLNRRYAAKWNYLIWIFLGLRLLIPFHGAPPANIMAQFTSPVTAQDENVPTSTPSGEAMTEQRIIIEIPPQLMTPIVTPSEKGNTGITLLNAIAAVWFAGAVSFVSLHFFSYLHYKRQLLKRGTAIKNTPSSQLLLCLSEELNIKQTVTLIEYPEADSPMMMGFLKPVLVLPNQCCNAEELYFILKHELVHLKRHDIYAKLLFMLANAVHWFNPLIWLMQKEAVIDMELSCDERVVQGAEYTVRRAYTETLFSTLKRKHAKKTVLSTQFYGGKQIMKKRFKNILENAKKKNGVLFLIGAIALTISCGTLIGCSVGSSSSPEEEMNQETLAYLTAFDAQGLSFDTVEWVLIPSERATELGFHEDDGPNGFVIYNEEEKTLTLPFAKDCSCTVLDWQDSFAPMEITLEQFLAVLEERDNNTIPYWLTIKNNEIIKIKEQYIP